MALLLFYVALALSVSFLCSVMEAVLLSISASYIAILEQDRPKLGAKLKTFKDDIDRPLAAILSLNTIAHTVGAAGAGAQAAAVFGDAYIGVISAVLTFLILVVSEIIPKTLGAAYWRQLTPFVATALEFTIIIMWPLVKMSEILTGLLTKNKPESIIHRDEFIALAELGSKEGVFHQYESRVMQNLFFLRNIRTKDIMTPRTVVFALSESLTAEQVALEHDPLHFSRIPVHGTDMDDIKGFVLKSDILRSATDAPTTPLKEICRPIVVVLDKLTLHDLFEQMMNESTHIALVVDEYGGTEGVVTMEDFIETLLGLEIVDELDKADDMQEIARKQWEERAKRVGLVTDNLEIEPADKPNR